MTAGFQAYTNSGLVQIDGLTANYVLRQTISTNTSAGTINMNKSNAGVMYTFPTNVANLTITADSPLIALYSPSAYASIIHCANNNNGTWSVQIWSSVAAAIAVYVFDRAAVAAPSGAGYGLQVFDASGTLIVDTRQRMASVLDIQSGNIHNAGPGWGQWSHIDTYTNSWTYSTVSKVGVAALITAMVGDSNSSIGYVNIGGFQTSGNVVNYRYAGYVAGSDSPPANDLCFGSQFNWGFTAIDLSNI